MSGMNTGLPGQHDHGLLGESGPGNDKESMWLLLLLLIFLYIFLAQLSFQDLTLRTHGQRINKIYTFWSLV